jgi:filamentous hemagglutinin family protein
LRLRGRSSGRKHITLEQCLAFVGEFIVLMKGAFAKELEMKENRCRKRRLYRMAQKLVSVITLIFFSAGNVFALPAGQQVVNGQASFNTQGNNLTITNSPNAIINWQGFSINGNEAVRFIQQYGSSAILNRVVGQDPSRILGLLQSNGRVFLINPNGILFGQGARIDVNGLVASTLNISNQDFLAGKYNFTAGAVAGSIQNQGTITTPEGGKVYLIAPDIENSGIINSPRGEVLLAAGHSVKLVDSLSPDIAVVVSAPENKAVNLGQIVARSGNVGIYGGLISQKGIVNADSAVVGENGRIFFKAKQDVTLDAGSTTSARGPQGGQITIQSESGTTLVSGTVTATGNDGKGGDIQVLGNQVGLIDNARIDASGKNGGGTVLIGGDYQGKNPAVRNAEATYVGKDAVIKADATETGDGGKVIVWSDKATRIYGAISARGGIFSGNGGFVETSGGYLDVNRAPDLSAPRGAGGTWLLDPNNITIQAAGSDTNVTGNPDFTTLGDNAIVTTGSIQTALEGTDLAPGGANVSIVTGSGGANSQDGNITVADPVAWSTNKTLTLTAHKDINVNAAIAANESGGTLILRADSDANGTGTVIFGGGSVNMGSGTASIYYNPANYLAATYNADVANFNASVTADTRTYYMLVNNVTNLQAMSTNLAGVYALGKDIDASATSGWNGGAGFVPVGNNTTPFTGAFDGLGHTISDLYVSRPTTDYVGLFGFNWNVVRNIGLVGGNIKGRSYVGGLAGSNTGSISSSYSTGAVTGNSTYVGGLVGFNNSGSGTITNSYSTGAVTSTNSYVGGLVGSNSNNGTITNSYSTGAVSGVSAVGGLAGSNNTGTITNSYSTGAVSGTGANVGGLIGGYSGGTITSSYWDTDTSGQPTSGGGMGTGLTTAGMQTASILNAAGSGFNFTTTPGLSGNNWVIVNADGTLQDNSSDTAGATRPMLASEYSTTIANAHQLQLMAMDLAANYTLASNVDAAATNGAAYPSDMWTSEGFVPVGGSGGNFTGIFDGLGQTITNLYINRPATDDVGLFGLTGSSIIRNVGLVNVDITGKYHVGGLVGLQQADGGSSSNTILNSYSTGVVMSPTSGPVGTVGGEVGGLVGRSEATGGGSINITNSSSSAAITGLNRIGGIVGVQYSDTGSSNTIENSYSTGAVTGNLGTSDAGIGGLAGFQEAWGGASTISNSYHSTGIVRNLVGGGSAGGLVGLQGANSLGTSTITNSYNTAAVNGGAYVGGLVGWHASDGGTVMISGSYSTGSVTGTSNAVGGLVGYQYGYVGEGIGGTAKITDSYSTGAVNSPTGSEVGGLVGKQEASGAGSSATITNAYSTGLVTGTTNVGGLIGNTVGSSSTVINSYWDNVTSGRATSAGGTGLTTAQMKTEDSFSGWDFATTWGITPGITYPYLLWQSPGADPIPSGADPIPSGIISAQGIIGNSVADGNTAVALGTAGGMVTIETLDKGSSDDEEDDKSDEGKSGEQKTYEKARGEKEKNFCN